MKEVENGSMRGILQATAGQARFDLTRFKPKPPLDAFVDHYWVIHYELDVDTSYSQTVLSFPNIHMAFEQDVEGRRALIYGIPREPFLRELRGEGRVLGIRFRAGGFYPYWQRDVSELTGSTIVAADVFGPDVDNWMNTILDAEDGADMARHAERALNARLPERDPLAELAARIVDDTMDDRSIIKVEQICERNGLSMRQLQRLFHRYVGVTPKWVIKRFRLQEAAERIEQDESLQWAELATQLGYFDQAHFINDFKSVLGQPPSAYRTKLDNR